MARRKNYAWLIALKLLWLLKLPRLRAFVNREYTDFLASSVPPRPRAFSLWSAQERPKDPELEGAISDYTSWPALTDHSFSGRHLPPTAQPLPTPPRPKPNSDQDWDPVTRLWRRGGEEQTQYCQRSSVLFAFFAQWFTDSILRISLEDRRKNTSNHDIDLCQIYGLEAKVTNALRAKQAGLLRHRGEAGAEYPDLLCDEQGKVKDEYAPLDWTSELRLRQLLTGFEADFETRKRGFYATGLERGNSSIGYVAVSTLFLREHNRLCRELARETRGKPGWDDERLFQTARMINIVILLKLLLEDYINHILGQQLFLLDPTFAERRNWYRANWIALEFDLLYRWHGLIPDSLSVGGKKYLPHEFRNNNPLFEKAGLGGVLEAASTQRAGKIGLYNTAEFLLPAEYSSLKMSRDFRLQGYNAYSRHFGLAPIEHFDDLTSDPRLLADLPKIYGGAGDVELLVGLFGEEPDKGSLFGRLMTKMVAYDALTHIYTNPLLSTNVLNEATFTAVGMQAIAETRTLQSLVDRNLTPAEKQQGSRGSLRYLERAGA